MVRLNYTLSISTIFCNQKIKIKAIFLISVLMTFGCSTKKHKIYDTLSAFYQEVIVFPKEILCYNEGILKSNSFQKTFLPKLVYYIDPTECSQCIITHLSDLSTIFEYADSSEAFDVIVLLSPSENQLPEVIEYLKLFPINRDVYIDYLGLFARNNPNIPKESLFHCFLLDQDSHPVFVGNPLGGEKIKELFMQSLHDLK